LVRDLKGNGLKAEKIAKEEKYKEKFFEWDFFIKGKKGI